MKNNGGIDNSGFQNDSNNPEVHALATITEVPRLENVQYVNVTEEPKNVSPARNNKNSIYYSIKEPIDSFVEKYDTEIRIARIILLNVLIIAYFIWATVYFFENKSSDSCEETWCHGYGMFFILLLLTYLFLVYFKLIKPRFGKGLTKCFQKLKNLLNQSRIARISIVAVLIIAFLAFIIVDSLDSPERLRSFLGIVILLGIGYAFSKHRTKIDFRPVIFGTVLQFLLGIFCIRMEIGRNIFGCLGKKVAVFFDFATQGSRFVYGTDIVDTMHVFAFSVLPVIFFFSFIVSILYYYGIMQWVIRKLGWLLTSIMGTTLCESVTVAANIFLGMTESPLIIKPYIRYLTASELHVIMSSGFATVSGTVLAAYIDFGADASHLITSSVMAAPATLAFSKLIYPETEVSQTTSKSFSMEKSPENSVLDAASNGAFAAVALIAGIIANLVAFVSFVAFINSVVGWLGMLVGFDFITLEWFLGKLFIPLAYIIGIDYDDCEKIGAVIATKNIVNEFVAYKKLGELKESHEISLRSAAITTFAICGFANLSSLGMMIGNLGTMCPEKKSIITAVSVRALISGTIICFINASIAGLLMTSDIFTATEHN